MGEPGKKKDWKVKGERKRRGEGEREIDKAKETLEGD